mmetsp:Transcript_467/g.1331  ORF Transcript_467/g.1331 Transcript_467/m.1331 type:complete len:493 (-) Transcript_467:1867-3345(-)
MFLLCVVGGHLLGELGAPGLSISQKHLGVLLIEDRVINRGIAGTHGTLHDNNVRGVPDLEHRHASNGRAWVLKSSRVDSVVGANDEDHVSVLEIVVDLLHLEDNVVWDSSLGEENVQLTRHPSSDGVNAELDIHALLSQHANHVSHSVLCPSHGKSVSRDNDHLLRAGHEVRSVSHRGLLVDSLDLLRIGGLGDSSKNHVSERPVHCLAHNVRQNSTRGTNKGSNGGEQVVVQHESLRAQRVSTVTVEQSDDHRHISSSDGVGHVGSKDTGGNGGGPEASQSRGRVSGGHQNATSREVGTHEANVDQVLSRKVHGSAVHDSVELSESHSGSSESDRANEGAKINCGLVHIIQSSVVQSACWIRKVHVTSHRSSSSGEPNQGVESGNHLRQVGDLHRLGKGNTCTSTQRHGSSQLAVHCRRGAHVANRSSDTRAHTNDSEHVSHSGGALSRKTCDRTDAAQGRGQVRHGSHLAVSSSSSEAISTDDCGSWHQI